MIIYKRFIRMLIAVGLIWQTVLIPFTSYAAEQRVFDEAKLLTAAQIESLERQVSLLRRKMNMDIVLVTADDAGGKNSRQYADDYYDKGDFGQGNEASGVLFLIDMDNRELWISTTGTMIRYLTDDRIDNMLDRSFGLVINEDYAGTLERFLEDLDLYYQKGIPGSQYNFDAETGKVSAYRRIRWYEALLAAIVSAFCAGSACLNVSRSYGMKKERKQARNFSLAYRADANYAAVARNDILRDTSVVRSIISSGNESGSRSGSSGSGGRSTTHSSSSGRSHGGGGRKF